MVINTCFNLDFVPSFSLGRNRKAGKRKAKKNKKDHTHIQKEFYLKDDVNTYSYIYIYIYIYLFIYCASPLTQEKDGNT